MAEGKREQHKRTTRKALRDAALNLFIEQGFASTSIGQIAAAAGVADRTFYRYFDSKEDLLLSDTHGYLREVEEFLAHRELDEPPLESMLALRAALEERWTLGDDLIWLSNFIRDIPAVRGRFLTIVDDHHDWLVRHFADRSHVSLDDMGPWLWASVMIAAYLSSIRLYVQNPTRSSWDYAEEIVWRLSKGLQPPSDLRHASTDE
jgi:AcrR family transcriptional regulator